MPRPVTWFQNHSISNKAARVFCFVFFLHEVRVTQIFCYSTRWLRHDSGNRARNIFWGLKSGAQKKMSSFLNDFSLKWKCVCVFWLSKSWFESQRRRVVVGRADLASEAVGLKSQPQNWSQSLESDSISPSLCFLISEKENVTKFMGSCMDTT